ncbi:hypothetical protein ACTFIR_007612 [Dictyostelium discoideum]
MEMINTVAASFLLKYFTLLIKTPENLKDFYHQNSKITRRFENGKANILTSYDNINEFLVNNSAKFGGNANISSIDCQPLGESIFMTCIGSIGFDGNVRRFLQSFYLEKIQGSFFISNDIFAFTSDEVFTVAIEQPDEASNIEQDYQQQTVEVESTTTTTTTTTAVVAASPTVDTETVKQPEEPVKVEQPQPPTPKASNVEQIIETTSTTTTTTAAAAVTTINASTSTPTPTETKAVETTKKPEPTTTTQAEKPKETTTTTTTPAPHQKQTWAQLVLINSTAQTASASEEPTQSSSSSSSQPSSSPSSSSSSSVNNNSNTNNNATTTTTTTANKQKDDHHFSKDGNTVFISFKSSKVDQAPIKEAFNQFGVVSNVRILTGYGFVEFEKPESVQNALNYASTHSNKINVAGNIIKVEERRGALPTGKQQQQSPPSSSSPSSSQPLKQQTQQPYKRQPQNNGAINLKYNNQQNKPNLNGNNINNNNNNNNSNNQNNFRKPQKVDNKKEASK